MDEKTLKDGKVGFLIGLYKYKEGEERTISSALEVKNLLEAFHAKGVIEDIPVKDITKLVRNKYTFLVNEILKGDFDLVFFMDYDEKELYPSNFFVGMILQHFVIKMIEIENSCIDFLNALEEFDKRAVKISKKKLHIFKSFLEGKEFYEFDDYAVECVKKIHETHRIYQDKIDSFYKEQPVENYPDLVEDRLRRTFSEEIRDKEKLIETLSFVYEIDVDFLRFTGKTKYIDKVRRLYLSYMQTHNLDTSKIVEEPNERYFVSPRKKVFDSSSYLRSELQDITHAVLELELPSIEESFNTDEYEKIRNILKEVGIFLTDPVIISDSKLLEDESPNTGSNGPSKKMT